jgi:hypothetical protein
MAFIPPSQSLPILPLYPYASNDLTSEQKTAFSKVAAKLASLKRNADSENSLFSADSDSASSSSDLILNEKIQSFSEKFDDEEGDRIVMELLRETVAPMDSEKKPSARKSTDLSSIFSKPTALSPRRKQKSLLPDEIPKPNRGPQTALSKSLPSPKLNKRSMADPKRSQEEESPKHRKNSFSITNINIDGLKETPNKSPNSMSKKDKDKEKEKEKGKGKEKERAKDSDNGGEEISPEETRSSPHYVEGSLLFFLALTTSNSNRNPDLDPTGP